MDNCLFVTVFVIGLCLLTCVLVVFFIGNSEPGKPSVFRELGEH